MDLSRSSLASQPIATRDAPGSAWQDMSPEFLVLDLLARRQRPLRGDVAALIRTSPFWDPTFDQLSPERRPTARWKIAALAGILALGTATPSARAEAMFWVWLTIYDAGSGEGLSAVQVLDPRGRLLGETDAQGVLNALASSEVLGRLTLRRAGYADRTFTYRVGENSVAMRPAPGARLAAAPNPGPRATLAPKLRAVPAPRPSPALSPAPVTRPSPAPSPAATLSPQPSPAPRPSLTPQASPPSALPASASSPAASRPLAQTPGPLASSAASFARAPHRLAIAQAHRFRPKQALWSMAPERGASPQRWGPSYRLVTTKLAAGTSGRAGERPTPALAHLSSGTPHRYRVKPGDSLWRIARRELGNPRLWPILLRANRDVLPNARLLQPGLEITIPG